MASEAATTATGRYKNRPRTRGPFRLHGRRAAIRATDHGWLTLDSGMFPSVFAGDVDPAEAAVQKPMSGACFGSPAGPAGWHSLPTASIRSADDQMINPLLQSWFAERTGAAVTDPESTHALVAIMSAEGLGTPLSPKDLRSIVGLSSGGTSYVIDRLESAGHIRRERSEIDRRVVHLHYTDQGMATGLAFFGPLGARTEEVMDQFDDGELEIIERFLTGAAESMREHLDHLRAQEPTESGTLPEDA